MKLFSTRSQMETKYSVLRETFHVPSFWKNNDDFAILVNHKSICNEMEDNKVKDDYFQSIETALRNLGYYEKKNLMTHDYLRFMLYDLLAKNNVEFLTKANIQNETSVTQLFCGTTPNFILKRSGSRAKTLIIDLYDFEKDMDEIKSKFRLLEFFADFRIINPLNMAFQLSDIVPKEELDYVYTNWQSFMYECHLWHTSVKLKKIIPFNYVNNANLRAIEFDSAELRIRQDSYLKTLANFAAVVARQEDI